MKIITKLPDVNEVINKMILIQSKYSLGIDDNIIYYENTLGQLMDRYKILGFDGKKNCEKTIQSLQLLSKEKLYEFYTKLDNVKII